MKIILNALLGLGISFFCCVSSMVMASPKVTLTMKEMLLTANAQTRANALKRIARIKGHMKPVKNNTLLPNPVIECDQNTRALNRIDLMRGHHHPIKKRILFSSSAIGQITENN